MELSSSFERTPFLTSCAAAVVAIGAGVLLLFAETIIHVAHLHAFFLMGSFAPYVVGAGIVIMRIDAYHPHPRFGAANVVTLIRLIITCISAGLVAEVLMSHAALSSTLMWFFFEVASLGLILDAVDGSLARRQGLESPFGSRFDMEVDALQILFLAVMAFALGKAGAWVLMSGALRYIYVAAGAIWPRLNTPLKPSWRRKTIAAIQSSAVTALLAPIVTAPVSTIVAATALALLVYSFTADAIRVLWPNRAIHDPAT